ncbi:uncharacterized protein TNIN_148691 [Trichonephila inaurata madagascariensis]|uniref:Uncharacterized protein n=1 Tax=Trichonephila inaurata madagascariensis TaxID=2747483 RepID=A0A8X6YDQ2_9ARAC|nr:uncharacterized protein TNIN_148691 [Trichonephila inaurata madagascariensis]
MLFSVLAKRMEGFGSLFTLKALNVLILSFVGSSKIMKTCFILAVFMVMYSNGCCRESDYEGYKHDDSSTNLTENEMFTNFMRPQQFTMGTLLGLLVASIVVVIGSFLVLWRLCCDVEMRVTREAIQPLKSISQIVSGDKSPRMETRSVSGQSLLGHSSSSSGLEIA